MWPFNRKKESQYTCLIFDHGKRIIETRLTRNAEFLEDSMRGKSYAIVEPPVRFKNGKKDELRFLVDEQKGCTIKLERVELDFLKIRTNPDLLATVIGSRLVKDAFDIRPKMGTLIICLVAGVALGFFLGLFF